MTTFTTLVCAGGLALAGGMLHAQDLKAGAITVQHPYARATAAGQATGGGFLTLVNEGGADRLLSASADVAVTVQLHEMKMQGDVMKMREVDGIDLPAGQTVEFKPGGFHVMFIGLKAPLKAGGSFPMTLKFQRAGELKVDVQVEAPGAATGMKR